MSTDLAPPPAQEAPPPASPPPALRAEGLEEVDVPLPGHPVKLPFLSTLFGKFLILILLLSPTFAGVGYYLASQQKIPPDERLKMAVAELKKESSKIPEERDLSVARQIARDLESIQYRDPNFPGGVEYVLGMAAFLEADREHESFREQVYEISARYLRAAEERSVPAAYHPQWAYALAISLYRLGAYEGARPLLETDILQFSMNRLDELDETLKKPEALDAALLLAELFVIEKDEDSIKKAKVLNDRICSHPFLTREHKDHDRAWLQRAQIMLSLRNNSEAERCLAQVTAQNKSDSMKILRAQVCMADGRAEKLKEAVELLRPLADNPGLDSTYARQATYLLGLCFLSMGNPDAAIKEFRKTEGHERTQEAVAACVKAGDIFRQKAGHDGDALAEYGEALRSVKSPAGYRNRWLDIEKFRQAIRNAWGFWVKEKKFEKAIQLSEMMSPLFLQEEAYDFLARATQAWAESRQQEYDAAGFTRKNEIWEDVKRRWNRSGRAYDRLADALTSSQKYPDAVWASADHFLKGQDFASALASLDRFIATKHTRLLPRAVFLRGRTLMDIGKFQDAAVAFKTVVSEYPTDTVAVEAGFLLGRCALELGKSEDAEKQWRTLLENPDLKPTAVEWQKSLLEVTRLKYREGEKLYREALDARRAGQENVEEQKLREAFTRWKACTEGFTQYLDRYSDNSTTLSTLRELAAQRENAHIRYQLARALSFSSELFLWDQLHAANENSRKEAQNRRFDRLDQSAVQYRHVLDTLQKLRDQDQLDDVTTTLLRNSHFEVAETLVGLGRYQQAIEAYTTAANRYPQQSDTLVAYVQIAVCYELLHKPAEARSMLEQAKVILREIPDKAFEGEASKMKKTDWARWLQWATDLNPDIERPA